MKQYTRPIREIWDHWKMAARLGVYPFDYTKYEDHEKVLTSLSSVEYEPWAKAYSDAARPFEEQARAAEVKGDIKAAKELYLRASGLYRLARWPVVNSPGKKTAYRKSQETFLAAARHFEIPVERVEIPFQGRPGEGKAVIAYFRKPKKEGRLPVLLSWGGLDYYKEDASDMFTPVVEAGAANIIIDIPGTADAPLLASPDAERMWDAVFAWIAQRPDLDAGRVCGWGLSTGGYWAGKVAHTHRDKFTGVVNHGGCAHYTFQADWIEKAQYGHYPFELAESLATVIGGKTIDDWADYAPKLSLLGQGVLDQPCTKLLLINGTDDTVFSPRDMQLYLQRGMPKTARFFPGEHMGITPDTMPIIYRWIKDVLRV
jgi:esterase FrsA